MSANFNFVKRGYEPREVDEHIDNLEGIIRSYKEKDNAIRNAILSAQIAADNIVQNAKNEATEIKSSAIKQLNSIISSIAVQRDMLKTFQTEYDALVEKYLRPSDANEMNNAIAKIDELEELMTKLANRD